jgi:hypothetical protein
MGSDLSVLGVRSRDHFDSSSDEGEKCVEENSLSGE